MTTRPPATRPAPGHRNRGQDLLRRRPPRRARRAQAWLDLENALYPFTETDDEALAGHLDTIVAACRQFGDECLLVACCDYRLAKRLVKPAHRLGIRLFPVRPAPDSADRALLARMSNGGTAHTDTVIIVSGDGAFADIARKLRRRGHQVVAMSPPGAMSGELRRAVTVWHPLDLREGRGMRRAAAAHRDRSGTARGIGEGDRRGHRQRHHATVATGAQQEAPSRDGEVPPARPGPRARKA